MNGGSTPVGRGTFSARFLLAAGLVLAYAALLVALLVVLAPAVPAAIVALLCALGSIGCFSRSRRSESPARSSDAAEAASPADQQFQGRPVFVVSRAAAVFCGVFSCSSSAGALFLGGGWPAPIAYGVTAVVALIVALRHRVQPPGPQ